MEILGIGIDIVENKRIKNPKLIKRFLSKTEYSKYLKLKEENRLEFLGGIWSAKESIIKASNKKITFSTIEISNEKSGKPIVFVNDKFQKNILISISHEKNYSTSFCIIYKN